MNKIQKGLRKIVWKTNDLLYTSSIKKLPVSNGKDGRIIVYHGVTKDARTDINARFIDTANFEKQLNYFKANCNVVSLEDYFLGARHPNKLTIAITFDDGYRNNLTEALPLLEQYQLPATFFITTIRAADEEYLWADLIDLHRLTGPEQFEFNNTSYKKGKHEYQSPQGSLKSFLKNTGWKEKKEITDLILSNNHFIQESSLFPYFKLLDEKEIQLLANSKYASIGSHALHHNCLTKIDQESAFLEITKSKSYLESLTQKKVSSFAYPDGSYDKELIELVEQAGYTQQLIVDYNHASEASDSRIQPRFGVNPYISFYNQVQCLVDGKY